MARRTTKKILSLLFASLFIFGFVQSAEAATYHMNADGTEDCSNLSVCFDLMSGGDELIIRDGIYKGSENAMSSVIEPPSGYRENYTSVRAENSGRVIFDGEGERVPAALDHREYTVFDGLVFVNSSATIFSITYSNHIKFLQCGFAEAGDVSGVSGDSLFFRYNDYMLVEESYIWGNGRYKFYMLDSEHVILRRCVVRADRGKDVGYSNQGSYRLYATSNSAIQNSISIDEGRGGFILTPSGETFVDSQPKVIWISPNPSSGYSGSNNLISGFIGLNNGLSLSGFVGNYDCEGNVFENSVFWGSRNAFWTRSSDLVNSVFIDHCTFGETLDNSGYHDHAVEADTYGLVSLKNSIVYGSGDSGVRNVISDFNSFFGNSYNYQNCSAGSHDYSLENENEINPMANSLKYLTRIESGSDLSGGDENGSGIGANILYRVGIEGTLWGEDGWNEITDESLWPFPNEDVMREHMANYYYQDETMGSISGARGFAAPGMGLYGGSITLTSYIWEYLGNPCPENICDYGEETPQATYTISDFIALKQAWLTLGSGSTDINQDNIVNARDLGIMMSNWEGEITE